jgi:hypothetical protein
MINFQIIVEIGWNKSVDHFVFTFWTYYNFFRHKILLSRKYPLQNNPFEKLLDSAQRLEIQPHGCIRDVATILAGFLQLHFGVHSLSLGHVACSRLLGLA